MQTLRLFVDVAKCRSFSRAAAQHGITQPAASQRISQLEKRLEVTLIDRSVRPLALTEAGQVFLEGCGELLDDYERLEHTVAALGGEPTGTVRVAAIYSSGIDLLNKVREGFEREHPKIAVEIDYTQPERVYRSVRQLDCELGILSYPQRWKHVGVIPLRNEVMAVVCRPAHELAQRPRVEPADLTPYEMVTFDRELPVGEGIRQYLREHGAAPTITHSFDNIDTIKNAVAVTDRFSILPVRTVSREVRQGELAAVELRPRLVRPLGVIHRPAKGKAGEPLSPPAQQFVDYLLAYAGEGAGHPPSSRKPATTAGGKL